MDSIIVIDIVKVFFPSTVAFVLGILLAPLITHYLYAFKAWKKAPGKTALDGSEAVEFNKLHQHNEGKTPRMGGLIIWIPASLTIVGVWLIAIVFPTETMAKLDFLSRGQTWIPLFTLLSGAIIGFVNDLLDIRVDGRHWLSLSRRIAIITGIALFVGWWFFAKLDVVALSLPFYGDISLGVFIIPFFVLVTLALYAGGVIDGIDGLSGGVFAAMFSAYAGIAFYQQQIDLAAFGATIVGAILAFLWFNIPPARFYMTETGTMGLTITLSVFAFMTDSLGGGHGVSVLPIIALPLVITVLSNIVQVASKRWRGKKVFRVAPLHHHFEAIGWPGYKVTMRYWIMSVIVAIIGMTIALIG